ncbi:restriction endonuclease [Fluviicola taffensis]|uniref:ATP-cone domain protein n=1 Tax=Fluviicola taffensis (strain DSM 16823 / NCIMB 13979 / RW262) TaxID=755732 RepID=F2I9I8_FLUTR|nr:restriction endonuclease [Fluviicola taffensis]AEA45169.1 ATP-cone domain protein [Fluviicola taffensis DSM 16823]
MHHPLTVTKASGEQSPFSEEKIKKSLRRSGADEDQIDFILQEIKKNMYNGMTTRNIYKTAYSLLKSGSRHQAARYHLKYAIMELGPSGFPFEKYIAELLKFEGYQTQIGLILQGKCVTHEIDIIAEKDHNQLLIECKYHNQQGITCNIKIPLYIHARFNDIEAHALKKSNNTVKKRKGWIVTNTRFTADAIQYAGCSEIQLLGWDHPFGKGLKDKIDESKLYPITCLTSLTLAEKQQLLSREIVLCNELQNNGRLLSSIGIKTGRMATVLNEVHRLCDYEIKIS